MRGLAEHGDPLPHPESGKLFSMASRTSLRCPGRSEAIYPGLTNFLLSFFFFPCAVLSHVDSGLFITR